MGTSSTARFADDGTRPDLRVAAVAERHAAAVLHYDADYDRLADHTDLVCSSMSASKRGSVD